MTRPSTRELVQAARQAGYGVSTVEQLRPNRWLLVLTDGNGAETLVLIQARPLISSVDVQDLADIVRLRRPVRGILLAHGGSFSPGAQRTLQELADDRLKLCTALPAAPGLESGESRQFGPAMKSLL
jgi:hypothetical protein